MTGFPIAGFPIRMRFTFLVMALAAAPIAFASEKLTPAYFTNGALEQHLRQLVLAHSDSLRMRTLTTTRRQRPVWLIEAGRGTDAERAQRPAMLVVAGIEGNDLAGTTAALVWVSHLLNAENERSRKLIENTTFYVLPRLNPDAAESFFAHPKWERLTTDRPHDDDHDGLLDEDGPEDLNGDGLITWMRVEDGEGDYFPDPAEPRLLVKADRAKGETGGWRYLIEGRDNDSDEQWNEDALGGVNLNANFAHAYRFFAPDSGQHPMSELETRALADFVVDHPNIGIVFTFGAADNLIQTPEAKEERGARPPTSLQKDDLPYYRELGKTWREALGLKKELKGASQAGSFSDWMYYHRGRFSLAARPWSPALQVELAKGGDKPAEKASDEKDSADDKTKSESPAARPKDEPPKREADNRNEDDRAFLKWIDRSAPEAFVPWKAFEHPDFPGRKVEIGGFAPFARSNPPENLLAALAEKQAQFLTELAGKLPRLGVRKAEAKHLGNSVYEVVIEAENTGYLPTTLAQGEVTREVLPTRVILDVPDTAILSGAKRTSFERLEGSGGRREARSIIHAKGRDRLEAEVISTLGGTVRRAIPLQ